MFFFAGFETSSSTMAFCLYELALNPDIQEEVRREIDTVLDKHGGNFTYESLFEMEYLEKVVDGKRSVYDFNQLLYCYTTISEPRECKHKDYVKIIKSYISAFFLCHIDLHLLHLCFLSLFFNFHTSVTSCSVRTER